MKHELYILRTDFTHPDFQKLVAALDKHLVDRYGDAQNFYAQYNGISMIRHAVVAYLGAEPVGCGAFKEYEPGVAEVKRMYVPPAHRGQGIAGLVLQVVEQWAAEEGYHTCILETGIKQPEAIRLYQKSGYASIPNFGQYAGVDNSVCFEKKLISK